MKSLKPFKSLKCGIYAVEMKYRLNECQTILLLDKTALNKNLNTDSAKSASYFRISTHASYALKYIDPVTFTMKGGTQVADIFNTLRSKASESSHQIHETIIWTFTQTENNHKMRIYPKHMPFHTFRTKI